MFTDPSYPSERKFSTFLSRVDGKWPPFWNWEIILVNIALRLRNSKAMPESGSEREE